MKTKKKIKLKLTLTVSLKGRDPIDAKDELNMYIKDIQDTYPSLNIKRKRK